MANAFVLCPTPRIIIKYVDKENAKAPKTAYFIFTLIDIMRI